MFPFLALPLPSMPGPRFAAEPMVLGGLGISPTTQVEQAATKQGLRLVTSRHDAFLFASHAVANWFTDVAEGVYWNPLDRSVKPASAEGARVHAMSAGLEFTITGPALHNDLLGIQPLYWMQSGEGVMFSNWMGALTAMRGDLNEDDAAWTSTLLVGFAPIGRTVFREVSSLPPNSTLSVTGGKPQVISDPLDIPVGTGSDLIPAIRQALPPPRQPAVYTLSGGWDSRLLASIASGRRLGRRIETWTTGKDDGAGIDLYLARPVARALRSDHYERLPGIDYWPASVDEALTRFEYSTWDHVWLAPLASAVRQRRRPVVDGLAGDVLLKGLFQDPEDDRKGSSVDARRGLWLKLGGRFSQNDVVWSDEALRRFENAFEDFDSSIQGLRDQTTWQTLTVLVTRTARTIGLSPLRLFGPEVPIYLPFVTLPVLASALGPDVHPHRGSDFYRALISSISPKLGGLPSTNDEGIEAPEVHRIGHLETPALEKMVETIRDQGPALELLGPGMRNAIAAGDPDALRGAMARYHSRVLWSVHAYAAWRTAHGMPG